MAGWHHWLGGRGSEWTPGVGDGQGGMVYCNSWGRKESDTTERLNWTKLNWTLKRRQWRLLSEARALRFHDTVNSCLLSRSRLEDLKDGYMTYLHGESSEEFITVKEHKNGTVCSSCAGLLGHSWLNLLFYHPLRLAYVPDYFLSKGLLSMFELK